MAQINVQKPAQGVTERRFSAAARSALGAAVKHWHASMMPRHFTTAAVGLYGYKPRTAKYMRYKARVVKHQRPLTFSGQSRDQAEHDVKFVVRKVGDYLEASAVMLMPDYFVKSRNNGPQRINKPDELTRTTSQEERELADVFTQHLAQELGRSTFSLGAVA